MLLIEQPGGSAFALHAPRFEVSAPTTNSPSHLFIGLMPKELRFLAQTGQSVKLAQFLEIVRPGLLNAKHVFRGLKRGMLVGSDGYAARSKLAVSWRHPYDAQMDANSRDPQRVNHIVSPSGATFVVYISPNEMVEDFPQIYGWAEHWTWVASDSVEPEKPVDWRSRFDLELWSAPQAGAM